MRAGQVYVMFGCTWIVDRVYEVTEEYAKEHNLFYRMRYSAHVIDAPEGYKGVTRVDAGLA